MGEPGGVLFDAGCIAALMYSPWSEREIWSFLKVAISPKLEWPRQPKLVCMHLTSSYTCMIFLSRFRSIEFFDDHGL